MDLPKITSTSKPGAELGPGCPCPDSQPGLFTLHPWEGSFWPSRHMWSPPASWRAPRQRVPWIRWPLGYSSTLWMAVFHLEDFLCPLPRQRLRKESEVEVMCRESRAEWGVQRLCTQDVNDKWDWGLREAQGGSFCTEALGHQGEWRLGILARQQEGSPAPHPGRHPRVPVQHPGAKHRGSDAPPPPLAASKSHLCTSVFGLKMGTVVTVPSSLCCQEGQMRWHT